MIFSSLVDYIYKDCFSYKFRDKVETLKNNRDNFIKFYRRFLYKEIKNPLLRYFITRHYLDYVEIEIFSFCNRQCWFCPNSFIDRHSQNIFMKEETYLKILKDLKSIGFKGGITYSRYNEPTADKIFLTRLKQAREMLPEAILFTHSNGDYITKEYIDELADAGLNLIRLQCYLNKNEKFDLENVVIPKMEKNAQRIGLPYKVRTKTKTCYEVEFEHPKLSIIWEANDFEHSIGVNRGETIEGMPDYERKKPCLSPFRRMYIDYEGSVMPCCQVRHDVESHKNMIMGNVEKESLFEIFTGKKFADLRKHLACFGPKKHPCTTCTATEANCVFEPHIKQYVPNLKKEFIK